MKNKFILVPQGKDDGRVIYQVYFYQNLKELVANKTVFGAPDTPGLVH